MEQNGPEGPAKIVRPPFPSENKTRIPRPMVCKVLLLNGEEFEQAIDKRSYGQLLYERVCDFIDLLERDYFGLRYKEDDDDPESMKYWLDPNKKVTKQKKRGKMQFEFALKFYPPDPTQLAESLTRYLVTLQIRRDIISGKLPCSIATQGMLGSYAVQADLGDYDPLDHGVGIDYIREMPFSPDTSDQLLTRIAQLHKKHKGETPQEAELHYLEYAKKIALYGIDLHKAKDSDHVDIMIGVGATGISIYRDNLRINRFVWPKILKISYRRNKFLLRIRPAEFDAFESWIAFRLPGNKMAKRLWKIAVEHHAFLRLRAAEDAKKRTGFPRFGSKYRYSGRTLYQTRLNASMADRPSKHFERSHSNKSLNSVLNNNRSRSQEHLNFRQPYIENQLPDFQDQSLDVYHQMPRSRQPLAATDNNLDDGRTPLQSPLPIQESPKFPSRQIIHHKVNKDEDDLDSRLPPVPADSPKQERRSPITERHSPIAERSSPVAERRRSPVADRHSPIADRHSPKVEKHSPKAGRPFSQKIGGVATPLAALDTSLKSDDHEKENQSDNSPRGSLDSVDLKEEKEIKAKAKPPPVAPKPKKEKPPVAEKPQKPEKPPKPDKPSKGLKLFRRDKKEKESPQKKELSPPVAEKEPMREVSL